MTVKPQLKFELRCRVAGCVRRENVHVTRSIDPRMPLETAALLSHTGWTVMFRQTDSFSLAVSALCSEHADSIWEGD